MRDLFKGVALFFAAAIVFTSCNDNDDNIVQTEPLGDYEEGIFVTSEGGSISGSVDFIASDFSVSENSIYANVNNEELGTYFQSAYFDGDYAYLVVDNANTITVVNRYTFEKVGTITGLLMPIYMTVADGKGYVTNWGDPFNATDDFIAVVNLENFAVESTISVGEGPQQLVATDGQLFVTHLGGYSSNNIVSVIDLADNTVSTITVEDNPDDIVVNNAGEVVVLSQGATLYDANWNPIGDTVGSISFINTSTLAVDNSFAFAEGNHPSLMAYNNGVLYYVLNGSVYSMTDAATELPTSADLTLDASVYAYGMAVDNNNLYILNASFTELSDLLVYDLGTFTETYSFEVGLGASHVYFN
ncbi:YncE family protein [Neptunitalea lumnitzerae]|nr:DUF5074 domain-containing protein [Neptunitalea sp. Y10]